ncbi:MAG: GlyGly-CTERM sorting domain-containing protein, partial [Shewanella sp.]
KAELVTPRLLAVDKDKGTISITIKNDDEKPVTPPTPPTPTPTPDKSSGGGTMGYLSLLLLAAVRLFRK